MLVCHLLVYNYTAESYIKCMLLHLNVSRDIPAWRKWAYSQDIIVTALGVVVSHPSAGHRVVVTLQ